MKRLYYGDNMKHEFWQSDDNVLLILRNHGEQSWSAHRNYCFVAFAGSAQEAAGWIGATLDSSMTWTQTGPEEWKLQKPI